MSVVLPIVIATPEWHHYCPKCETSYLERMDKKGLEGIEDIREKTCSNCGEVYVIKKDYNDHCKQPRIIRKDN